MERDETQVQFIEINPAIIKECLPHIFGLPEIGMLVNAVAYFIREQKPTGPDFDDCSAILIKILIGLPNDERERCQAHLKSIGIHLDLTLVGKAPSDLDNVKSGFH